MTTHRGTRTQPCCPRGPSQNLTVQALFASGRPCVTGLAPSTPGIHKDLLCWRIWSIASLPYLPLLWIETHNLTKYQRSRRTWFERLRHYYHLHRSSNKNWVGLQRTPDLASGFRLYSHRVWLPPTCADQSQRIGPRPLTSLCPPSQFVSH